MGYFSNKCPPHLWSDELSPTQFNKHPTSCTCHKSAVLYAYVRVTQSTPPKSAVLSASRPYTFINRCRAYRVLECGGSGRWKVDKMMSFATKEDFVDKDETDIYMFLKDSGFADSVAQHFESKLPYLARLFTKKP